MLFNSYEFIFGFLPIALVVFYGLRRFAHYEIALSALVIACFVFYGWWDFRFVPLLAGSIVFNYAVGRALSRRAVPGTPRRGLLVFGVAANLAVLGWFKYFNFFLENVEQLLGTGFEPLTIILPLAISFFTFQQIAFLADASEGRVTDLRFVHYALFVAFFPQLIAGPIVHHAEMIPQFERGAGRSLRLPDLVVGATIFCIGLWKKVIVADGMARYADPLFDGVAAGQLPALIESWVAALSFTFQIYFDFSGYSDMAIGLGRMFGILLPLNFNSPYKSASIIEFWERWHMTLARFLRDYVYIALGSLRRSTARRRANLFLTMLLCGLWHGAGWTFVIWGGMQGVLLLCNHYWRDFKRSRGILREQTPLRRFGAQLATFCAVAASMVVFRAADLASAGALLGGMLGLHGFGSGDSTFAGGALQIVVMTLVGLLVFALPNTQEFLSGHEPAFDWRRWQGRMRPALLFGAARWRPSLRYSVLIALLAATALTLAGDERAFVYFQF